MAQQKVRFVRVRGRVIPIRQKIGDVAAATTAAASVAALGARQVQKTQMKFFAAKATDYRQQAAARTDYFFGQRRGPGHGRLKDLETMHRWKAVKAAKSAARFGIRSHSLTIWNWTSNYPPINWLK